MTLQEKLDKLPLSIEYDGRTYVLRFGGKPEYIFVEYFNISRLGDYHVIVDVENVDTNMPLSQRLEDVVNRAITLIENKEWEK